VYCVRDIKHTLLVISVLVTAIIAGQGCRLVDNTVSEINLDATEAPYSVNSIYCYKNSLNKYPLSLQMADLDGDGVSEYVHFGPDKLLGRDAERGTMNMYFEVEVPRGFSVQARFKSAGVAQDLMGQDGIDELYFTIGAHDHSAWRLMGLNPADKKFFLDVSLPLFESTRKEPWWDGRYCVAGYLDDADDQGNPGIVLVRQVGYDVFPRGILVVSPYDGETIWEYRCGGNVSDNSFVVTDLENDGTSEIIFHTTSPQNLGGRLVNGTSDDVSYLFVISNTGEELFRESMSEGFSTGTVATADLTGDGVQELIAISENTAVGSHNSIRIMDWKKEKVLAQKITPYSFRGLVILEGSEPGTNWLISGSNKATINRFLFDGQTIVCDRSAHYGVGNFKELMVLGSVDVLDHPGDEIIVDIDQGKYTVLLDKNLNSLAVYEDPSPAEKSVFAPWNVEKSNPMLICGGSYSQHTFEFTRQRLSLAQYFSRYGLPVLLGGAFLGMFFLGKMRGKKEQIAVDSKSSPLSDVRLPNDRAALYRLWQELDDVKHESLMEASKGLRRLVWLLDAYSSDLGGTVQLEDRIRKLRYDFLESVYPRLQEILHHAAKENFEFETVQSTDNSLASLAHRLEELLREDELTREKVLQSREIMNADLQNVEAGFLHLWAALKSYFTTDPVRMLEGMLVVREVEFQRAGISTEVLGENDPQVVNCIIDSGDIRYVLDNLVDNAVRAMEDSQERRLMVQTVRENGELALHVSDTGCGIDFQDYGKIFKGRFSSRAGGGMGLARSNDIMKKWLGEINLVDSTVGQGTTFVVKLRAAQKVEDAKTMEAES